MSRTAFGYIVAGLVALSAGHSCGNPTGGQVSAGSATINTVPGTVTVNQQSNIAIINWNTFSIGTGELTKFIQPSSSSAVLNRVLGGQTSNIVGTLSANGQVYLVNGNGIVIGPGGLICADSFTASTRDIADSDFLNGNLHFVGGSAAGVTNKGTINALGGDVYLIGQTVYNRGIIRAENGTVGLAAGEDVLLGQQNPDGSTMTVNPSPLATAATGQVGVANKGKIKAATVELKAANGNLYALAINNTGIIRATTVTHQGGHIYLSSDSGTVVNARVLDASADVGGTQGGTVAISDPQGTTDDYGVIRALGGEGGVGGNVGISSPVIQNIGVVNTTAPDGKTGDLVLTPSTFTVAATGGDETGAQVDANLATTNYTINADNSVVINDAITWTTGNALTLSTNDAGSTIFINSPISGVNGGLIIDTAGVTDAITTSAAVNVASFILQNGSWSQNGSLPAFAATSDFEIQAGSFLRASGGSGTSADPYVITDVYGLQGIASLPLGNSYEMGNNIDASGTSTWNSGAGFDPIGEVTAFSGTFNGQGFAVNGLFIDRPDMGSVGLFGTTSGADIKNVGVTNATVTGETKVGALVGDNTNDSIVDTCYSSGTMDSSSWTGGLVGFNETDAVVNNSQSSATVESGFVAGGLVGENYYGVVQFCSSTGSADGEEFAGGLVGGNYGTISNSYSFATVNSSSGFAGGLSATIEDGSITDCYSAGVVTGATTGGLVGGEINGTATDCFWDEQTSGITAQNGAGTPEPTAFFGNAAHFPASWNFSTVWFPPTGPGSYPTLRSNPYVSPVTPVPTTDESILDTFGAYTANGSPPLVDLSFYPFDIGNDLVSVDNPDGDGGAINDGSHPGKKGTNIASGSSTSGAPALSRLLTSDSGINSIFRGTVNPVQPSALILQKFDLILNNTAENELQGAVFGTH